MPVAAPSEGYIKMINYGQKKAQLRLDQLLLQSFLAGLWVAIYGHCCTVFASQFSSQPVIGTGLAHLAYGVLFPGAFVAVVYTGTELFTGNTVTMIMLVCNDGWRAMHHLVRVWIASCFGNLAGAVFGSFFISYLSGAFQKGLARTFLFVMTKSKLEHNFGQALILGVGCNALVCLATWCVVCSDDGAGKILAMFYSIGVFAMGGFEHVVANFYTLTTAAIHGYKEHTFGQIVVNNWIPVLLGNILAGTMFTGVLWWYALHPSYSDLAAFSNKELSVELSQRCAAPPTPVFDSTYINQQHDAAKPAENAPRWRREVSTTYSKSGSYFMPPHLVPTIRPSETSREDNAIPSPSPSQRNP